MAEKTDSDGEAQLSISSEIARILRERWPRRPYKPDIELKLWERFLFSFLGSMYAVGYSLYGAYLQVPFGSRLFDILVLYGFIFSFAFLAIPAGLAALVTSTVDRGHSPFRLYMGGFFVLYLPWLLLSRATM